MPNLLLLVLFAVSFMLYGSFSAKTVSSDLLLESFVEGNAFKLMNAAAISLAVKTVYVIVKRIYILFVNYVKEQRGEETIKSDNVIFENINVDFLVILWGYTLLLS